MTSNFEYSVGNYLVEKLVGIYPGNSSEVSKDYSLSQQVTLIPPTGLQNNFSNIIKYSVILLIVFGIIIFILRKKN